MEILSKQETIELIREQVMQMLPSLTRSVRESIKNNKEIGLIDVMVNQYCEIYNVKKAELLSISRQKTIVDHRHILFVLLRKQFLSLNEIGQYFERDHSTVLSGIHKIEDLMIFDKEFRNRVEKALEIY